MDDGGEPNQARGSTRTLGIIGWPVAHSLSPVIHNAVFVANGMDWIYVPLPVRPERLGEALDGLIALGFAGANITMPHKTGAAERISAMTDDASLLRAVNTVTVEDGALRGHNTDAPGFDRFIRRDAGFDPHGRDALIFGAGGAARAAALALARGGLATLTVAVRDPGRASQLRGSLEGVDMRLRVVALAHAAKTSVDLVVNATPLGRAAEVLPTPPFRPGMVVVDLFYEPSGSPLQTAAKQAGAAAYGGLGLLLHQAALSFEIWTGAPAPMALMSAAALAALAEHR